MVRKRPPRQPDGAMVQVDQTYSNLRRLNKLTLSDDRDPWRQQPKEAARHYGLFQMYLQTPPHSRSLRHITEISGWSQSRVAEISAANHWVARVAAYDIEQHRLYQLELAEKRKKAIELHIRVSDAMMRKGLERLVALQPEDISPRDLGGFLGTAAEIARRALGMDAGQQSTSVQVTATTGDTEGGQAARVEVKVAYEQALQSMEELAARMTPEQVAEAAEGWRAAAGKVIDGEVV